MASNPSSVAYLGPEGSYSHQAAQSFFPTAPLTTLHPAPSISHVFAAVQSRAAAVGVVPLENSTNGPVLATLDLLTDALRASPTGAQPRFRNVRAAGLGVLRIRMCLLGLPGLLEPSPSTTTTTENAGERTAATTGYIRDDYPIDRILTHPQAWTQCSRFLARLRARNPQLAQVDAASTSQAAREAAADGTGRTAAIASREAGRAAGLAVWAADVHDRDDNGTRFLLVRFVEEGEEERGAWERGEAGERWTTMVGFTVAHDRPGALADALSVFKARGLDLTSINARPSGEVPWHYVFLLEFHGNRGDEGVEAALADLARAAEKWMWLGSWRHPRELWPVEEM